MDVLDYNLIFCKVFPQRNVISEVLRFKDPVISYMREGMHCVSTLGASSEKPCQKNKWHESVSKPFDNTSECIMISHILYRNHGLLRSSDTV